MHCPLFQHHFCVHNDSLWSIDCSPYFLGSSPTSISFLPQRNVSFLLEKSFILTSLLRIKVKDENNHTSAPYSFISQAFAQRCSFGFRKHKLLRKGKWPHLQGFSFYLTWPSNQFSYYFIVLKWVKFSYLKFSCLFNYIYICFLSFKTLQSFTRNTSCAFFIPKIYASKQNNCG